MFRGPIETIFFIAFRDVLKNKLVLSVILIALAFLFTNLLFARFMVAGFRETLEYDVIKVSGHLSLLPKETIEKEEEDKPEEKGQVAQKLKLYNLEREKTDYIQEASAKIAQIRQV